MTSTTTIAATPIWMTRTGYGLSGVLILFLAMDITIKLLRLPVVLETTLQLGGLQSPFCRSAFSCSSARYSTHFRAPACSALFF